MTTIGAGSPPPQASPTLLHRALAIGLTAQAVVLAGVRYAQRGGLTPDPDPVLAYALSGIGAAMALVALLVLRRRVPEPRPGRTAEQYWADRKNAAPAMLFWFVLDGAGVVASVAYFLAGPPSAALLVLFIVAAFWKIGPHAFDGT